MSESVELVTPSPEKRSRRRGWIVAVVVVVVIGLAGAGFAAHNWLTGEHLFAEPGASESLSMQAGETIYVGLGPLPADNSHHATDRVDLRSVHPLVKTNTSDATVTVLTCLQATVGISSLIGGGTATDPHPYCGSVEGFRPGMINVGLLTSGLLLAVTPRRSGTVEVVGAHITYRVGMRSGSQKIGAVDLTVSTP